MLFRSCLFRLANIKASFQIRKTSLYALYITNLRRVLSQAIVAHRAYNKIHCKRMCSAAMKGGVHTALVLCKNVYFLEVLALSKEIYAMEFDMLYFVVLGFN